MRILEELREAGTVMGMVRGTNAPAGSGTMAPKEPAGPINEEPMAPDRDGRASPQSFPEALLDAQNNLERCFNRTTVSLTHIAATNNRVHRAEALLDDAREQRERVYLQELAVMRDSVAAVDELVDRLNDYRGSITDALKEAEKK